MMKDSTMAEAWIREQMAKNPPSLRPNGEIFSGPVRLSFPNIFEVGKSNDEGGGGKFGAALLFPLGTDMGVFERAWTQKARESFPKNWAPDGQPIGLHSPFHDQRDKAYAAKPLAGYTPGAIYFSATSNYKPQCVDANLRPVLDPSKVYPGVWAFVVMNVYSYQNKKTGVAFGMQDVMLIGDDTKLGGGGNRDPKASFAGVTITAQANVAAKFDQVAATRQEAPAAAGIMPAGGHVGQAGGLQVHALPGRMTPEEQAAYDAIMG